MCVNFTNFDLNKELFRTLTVRFSIESAIFRPEADIIEICKTNSLIARINCVSMCFFECIHSILSPLMLADCLADRCWKGKIGSINLLDFTIALALSPIIHLLGAVRFLLGALCLSIVYLPPSRKVSYDENGIHKVKLSYLQEPVSS